MNTLLMIKSVFLFFYFSTYALSFSRSPYFSSVFIV